MNFDAKSFLRTLPENPGVYRMIGAEEEVLYVGKAKNLTSGGYLAISRRTIQVRALR